MSVALQCVAFAVALVNVLLAFDAATDRPPAVGHVLTHGGAALLAGSLLPGGGVLGSVLGILLMLAGVAMRTLIVGDAPDTEK